MGAALYIVVENDGPDFDASVNGKALSKAEPDLKKIATELGVTPLMDFYGADGTEMAIEMGLPDPERFIEKWFRPEDGLATVRALIERVEGDPGSVTTAEPVIGDLKDLERVLMAAEDSGLRWHLAVDY